MIRKSTTRRVRYEDGIQTIDGLGASLYLEAFERSKDDGTKWDSTLWESPLAVQHQR